MSVSAVTALLVTTFVGGPAVVLDRLIVLGPHHSGTSIVAKALDGLGFYLGDAKDLLLHPDNPLKYWERRDARRFASLTSRSDRLGPLMLRVLLTHVVPAAGGAGCCHHHGSYQQLCGVRPEWGALLRWVWL